MQPHAVSPEISLGVDAAKQLQKLIRSSPKNATSSLPDRLNSDIYLGPSAHPSASDAPASVPNNLVAPSFAQLLKYAKRVYADLQQAPLRSETWVAWRMLAELWLECATQRFAQIPALVDMSLKHRAKCLKMLEACRALGRA